MNSTLVQLVGFVGLLFVVISFQRDRRSFTLLFQLLAALSFTAHYSLLTAWTGAAMNGLSALRAYVFHLRDSKQWINNKIIMYVFILLFWIAGALTWKSAISLLPVISMTLECFALWSNNTKHIRWLFLSARPMWITYNFLVGSYAGLVTEVFIVCSIVVAIFRFDIFKKNPQQKV